MERYVSDDSYVHSGNTGTNYGDEVEFEVKDGGSSFDRIGFLRFNVSEVPGEIESATLKLYVESVQSGSVFIELSKVASDSWSQKALNWSNKPTIGSLISSKSISASGWVEWDVTSYVVSQASSASDRRASFALSDTSGANSLVKFASREGEKQPVLEVTYATPPIPHALAASDDAYVQGGSNASTAFGISNPNSLEVKDGGADFDRNALIKFDVSFLSGVIGNAELNLYVDSVQTGTSGMAVDIHELSDDTWSESSVTWTNQPSAGSLIQTQYVDEATAGSWLSYEVTDHIDDEVAGDGAASFLLTNIGDNKLATFGSDESSNPPILFVDETRSSTPLAYYELVPIHDAHIRNGIYDEDNFGGNNQLEVKDAGANFGREAYIRFHLEPLSGTVHGAELKFNVSSLQSGGTVPIKVYGSSDNAWDESEITWNGNPSHGSLITTINVSSTGEQTVDVTSFVSSQTGDDGMATFLLRDESGADLLVKVDSSESSNPPRLEVDLEEEALAFPGAEGYGRYTVGGRGGQVLHVTNLNDSGAGSLRWALEDNAGPRYVVFDVAGLINLTGGAIRITDPYVTIAGQTAPGEGICIRHSRLQVNTHDVIIRGLRFRLDDEWSESTGSPGDQPRNRDSISAGDSNDFDAVSNVVIDRNSSSWTIDESMSVGFGAHHVTVTNNIFAEPLHDSIHIDEGKSVTAPHGFGPMLYRNGDRITFAKNLLTSANHRGPMISAKSGEYMTRVEIVNNYIFNWGNQAAVVTDGGTRTVHFIKNFFKRGEGEVPDPGDPDYRDEREPIYIQDDDLTNSPKTYLKGNIDTFFRTSDSQDEYIIAHGKTPLNSPVEEDVKSTVPLFDGSGLTELEIEDLAYHVQDRVGVLKPSRDPQDERIVDAALNWTEAKDGQGNYIDTPIPGRGQIVHKPEDVLPAGVSFPFSEYPNASHPAGYDSDGDGMPDAWEDSKGLNKFSNDANGRHLSSVYDNIEVYINGIYY